MNFWDKRRLDSSYDIQVKASPAQQSIYREEQSADVAAISSYAYAYSTVEAVGRGVDMVVDLAAEVNFDVKHKINAPGRVQGFNTEKLSKLLNLVSNKEEDRASFRSAILVDFILSGNAFMYFDGAHLHHLPANQMKVLAGKKVKIKGYEHRANGTPFTTDEIIHIKDNSATSNLVGSSRLLAARNSISTMYEMLEFQQNFFKNGAVPGLVLTTPNILGKKIKERLIDYWVKTYNPKTGGKRPLILDGDFKVGSVATTSFKELDFETSVDKHEDKILTAIGVPPILLKGGNNANIKPNMQLLYYTTIIPIMNKVLAGLEAFFGFDLTLDVSKIASLQPELQQQSGYYTALVNAGIISVNEAREALRFEKSDDPEAERLIKPANVAGSAADPSQGGRPPNEENK